MPETAPATTPTPTPGGPTAAAKKRGQPAAKPSRLPPLDWAAPHGPITGALSVTTGVGALAMMGAATGMPHPVPILLGGTGAFLHGVGWSLHRRLTGISILTRAGAWLGSGAWGTWAMSHGPLSWAAVTGLATLGVGIGVAASHAAIHEEAAEEERITAADREREREENRARTAVAVDWEARIKTVVGINVHIYAVQQWSNGYGFTLFAELPPNATWDKINSAARALAAAARLPRGVTIHVEEGNIQGRVVLDVPTKDVFALVHPYPEDDGFSPLSVLTGIPWGLDTVGEAIIVFLREAGAIILGPPGSGKSTFLDAVLIGFSRCTDVLTWAIDFKAGAIGRAWVRPWLEAQGRLQPRPGTEMPPPDTLPGIDWLASTPAEALLMVKVALALGAARQHAYQDLLLDQDTGLLPVSARIPQIEILIDEGAELLSASGFRDPVMRELQEGVKKVIRTLRAMGIRTVLTAVDGNVSAIGDTQIRKYSPVGAALTSAETASGNNLSKLFPNARIDTSQLTAQGTGVIGATTASGFPPTPFKGFKTAPSTVRRAILATNHIRQSTRLDAHLLPSSLLEAYRQRWSPQRAGWLWTTTGPGDVAGTAAAGAPATPPAAGGGLNLSYQRSRNNQSASEQLPAAGAPDADALAAELMRDLDEQFGTTDEPPPQSNTPSLNLSYMRTNPSEDGPEWLSAAIDAIAAAGPDGMKPGAVADLVGRDRKTVRIALQAAADRGALLYRENGPHSVYVHPDHA